MPDLSVYVTVINRTREHLNDPETSASWGQWLSVPKTIAANSQATFQLKDDRGFHGSDGTFSFSVRDAQNTLRANLDAYQACPWGTADNTINLVLPTPKALYVASFRASVDGGPWLANAVNPSGHPVSVEYTIDYQPKRFRFKLINLKGSSKHPVRNSRDELIVGNHILWSNANPSIYEDGKRGSFQPNIFGYRFESSVPEASVLSVTVQPLDVELTGAECLVYGNVDGRRVFQSDYFFFKKAFAEVTVQAHVITPSKSSTPFSWNANVEWGMELRLSNQQVDPVGPRTTRLELYWIAPTTHHAFQSGVPVGFLRSILKNYNSPRPRTDIATLADHFDFYADMTREAFGGFNKVYDTIAGASAFGMAAWGGIFSEAYYRAANESGSPGTLYRHVNCMDQAAMLELSCSLLGGFSSTSWLVQQPFGFITTTHLIGVANANGLIPVNNPFFGTEQSRALLGINDASRSAFGCHVYNGNSKPFNPARDGIYDACGGPHTGTETIAQYVAGSIDTQTNLYNITGTHPGTVSNVVQGDGVTGVNGRFGGISSRQLRGTDIALPEGLSEFFSGAQSALADTPMHILWSQVPVWLKSVLGNAWGVSFGGVTVNDSTSHAFWHLAEANVPDRPIRVNVQVVTVTKPDGTLNTEQSAAVARERVRDIVTSTSRTDIWTTRMLEELQEQSLQYAAGVGSGRIVVVAGNVVMDIAGMSSTAELMPYAVKLLRHTMRRNHSPFALPVLHQGPARTIRDSLSPVFLSEVSEDVIIVRGLDSRFSVAFTADRDVVAASADCEGSGVLFDRYVIEEVEGEDGNAADLMFVAREIGRHLIHVHLVDAETMVTATQDIQVEVVED